MKEQKQVNLIEKTYIKANGVTLYEFLPSSGTGKYFATVTNGKVECECKGFYYRGTCAHCTYILQEQSPLATYDVLAAAVQVLADCEIGDAYEQVEYVPVAERVVEEYKPNGLAETYDASWYRRSSNR